MPNPLHSIVQSAPIQVPGAYNALTCCLIEQMGFSAAYVSGAAFSAADLAVPDIGLFTLTELLGHVKKMIDAVDIPLIVDADTGFGEAINVERTVLELDAIGVAAIQLEDQELPKKCGHLDGKVLVSPERMAAHLSVAAEATEDAIIIARTDARAVEGIDQAINRAKRYLDAGANWIFPEAMQDRDEFEQFAKAIDAPLVANMTEFGKSPLLTFEELADLGYAAVIYPVTLLRSSMKAAELALAVLASNGTQAELLDVMQTREELYQLLNYDPES